MLMAMTMAVSGAAFRPERGGMKAPYILSEKFMYMGKYLLLIMLEGVLGGC